MVSSFFDDKTRKPDDAGLSRALGRTRRHWDAIIEHLTREYDGLAREWKFYGRKYGWQLKLAYKKRAVLYLVPHQGSFLAALALKDKAVDAVRASNLSPSLILAIESAKAYPEGRPARIEVTSNQKADIVKKLVAIKLTA